MHGATRPFLLMCLHGAYRENLTFGGNRWWTLWHLRGLRLDDHGLDNLTTGDRSPSLDEECQGTRSDITGEGETFGETGRSTGHTPRRKQRSNVGVGQGNVKYREDGGDLGVPLLRFARLRCFHLQGQAENGGNNFRANDGPNRPDCTVSQATRPRHEYSPTGEQQMHETQCCC